MNAYIKEADRLAQIYSDLHQNIQDRFNAEGVEIMSPHYMAMRDGNDPAMPKDDLSVALWGKGYLLRFTVCNTRPVLSIMRSSSVRGVAEMMEKPGSGLQYTVPSVGLTLRLSEPLELVT